MKPILYLLSRIYKNTFLQLVKKPTTLIAYLVFIVLMSFNSIVILIDDDPIIVTQRSLHIFEIIAFAIATIITLPSLYKAITKVTLPLRMADVNFLFTAPIKPAKILIYAQIVQAVTSMVIALFMLIQGPMLMKYLGVDFGGVVLFVLAWGILFVTAAPVYMCVFVLGNKFPRSKKWMKRLFYVFITMLVVKMGLTILQKNDLINGIISVLNAPYFKYIPLIGWYKVLFMTVINGITMDTMIIMGIVTITSFIASVFTMKLADTSFYEDAITSTKQLEKAKAAYKAGDHSFASALPWKTKVKTVSFEFKGLGAQVIRQKQILMFKKKLFFIVDIKSFISVVVSIFIAFLISQIEEIPQTMVLLGALFTNVYMILLFSVKSNNEDLSRHYIYMIPDNVYRKLIALSYAEAMKLLINASLSVLVVALAFGVVNINIILIPLICLSFGMQLYYMDMILDSFLGKVGTVIIRVYIKVFIMMLSILPGAVIAVILLVLQQPLAMALLITSFSLFLFDSVLFVVAAQVLKRPEFNR